MDDQTTAQETIRLIVRDEISTALNTHSKLCPFVGQEIDKRTRTLEQKVSTLWGYILGSAVVSGGTAAALTKLFPS